MTSVKLFLWPIVFQQVKNLALKSRLEFMWLDDFYNYTGLFAFLSLINSVLIAF